MKTKQYMPVLLTLVVCLAGAHFSLAANDYSEFIKLKKDKTNVNSFTEVGNWDDAEPPNPAKDYVICESKGVFRTPTATPFTQHVFTFQGNSLWIDTTDPTIFQNPTTGCFDDDPAYKKAKISYSNLHLVNGGLSLKNSAHAWTNCTVDVSGPNFVFSYYHSAVGWFRAEDSTFTGGTEAALLLQAEYYPGSGTAKPQEDPRMVTYYFDRCDFSGYMGTLCVNPPDDWRCPVTLALRDTTVSAGSKIDVCQYGSLYIASSDGAASLGNVSVNNGFLIPSNAVEIADLALTNATIDISELVAAGNMTGGIKVNGAFYLGGKLTVRGLPVVVAHDQPWFDVIDLPAEAKVSEGDFVYEDGNPPYHRVLFAIVTDPTTLRKKVRAKNGDVIKLLTDNKSSATGSSFKPGREEDWSDGRLPHGQADYLIDGLQLMTDDSLPVFPGDSLTLVSDATLALVAGCTISNLYLVGGVKVNSWVSTLSDGIITAVAAEGNTVIGNTSSKQEFSIFSEITGDGNLVFCPYSDGGNSPLNLCSKNTNFVGRIRLDYRSAKSKRIPEEGACQVFGLAYASGLGGPCATFTYDALTITEYQVLCAKNDIVLDEPTRGIYLLGNAEIRIPENLRLTIKEHVTWEGELKVSGAGTFALGGSRAFGARQSPDPTAGENVLTMLGGWLKPASSNACDGLSISFALGTGLRIDVAEKDADVHKYGLYNPTASAPFELADGVGKLPVLIDMDNADVSKTSFQCGLVTVATKDAAEAVVGRLSLGRVRGFSAKTEVVQNENGTWTVSCLLSRKGVVLIVR